MRLSRLLCCFMAVTTIFFTSIFANQDSTATVRKYSMDTAYLPSNITPEEVADYIHELKNGKWWCLEFMDKRNYYDRVSLSCCIDSFPESFFLELTGSISSQEMRALQKALKGIELAQISHLRVSADCGIDESPSDIIPIEVLSIFADILPQSSITHLEFATPVDTTAWNAVKVISKFANSLDNSVVKEFRWRGLFGYFTSLEDKSRIKKNLKKTLTDDQYAKLGPFFE